MIHIRSEAGDLIRILPLNQEECVQFHETFGFVTPGSLESRANLRKYHGLKVNQAQPDFSFGVKKVNNGLKVYDLIGLKAVENGDSTWLLESPKKTFKLQLVNAETTTTIPLIRKEEKESKNWVRIPALLAILLMLLMLFSPGIEIPPVAEEEVVAPPVVVQLQEKKTVVPVEKPKEIPKQTNQALDKKQKVEKALTQTLGFLKTMGRKDLKKAIGGLPTNVPEATAGAGPGGKGGSGGQLLVGLGQGLRRTTVGNTGLAGLGGIGTKGAGGGLGGYGDTDYGSGAGQNLSTIPLSRDAVMEGGLDRALIEATIMRYLSQVRACYEEGLKRKAGMIGQVTMNFEINGTGALNFSRVQRSSLNDRDVEECISKRMMFWKFPTPKGGVNVKVSYPFMLRPMRS
jgi:hypothetical protein